MNNLPIIDCDNNYIKETVARIDKLQKEVVSESVGRCISCETSLFTSANNTIPVTFTSYNGTSFTGQNLSGNTYAFFRIESIRSGRFVTLRLLEYTGAENDTTVTALDYTIILDLNCVAAMQCFEPINVEVCTSSQQL